MPSAGFDRTIPASERPLTHILDRAATGIVWTTISTLKPRCLGKNLVQIAQGVLDFEGVETTILRRIGNH